MGYTGSDPTIIQFEIKKSYQLLSRALIGQVYIVQKVYTGQSPGWA